MEDNKNEYNQRNLKVYGRYFANEGQKLKIKPEIRLIGNWVEQWGFKNGSKITVRNLEDGILIINESDKYPIKIHL